MGLDFSLIAYDYQINTYQTNNIRYVSDNFLTSILSKNIFKLVISVGSLPTTYTSNFYGARALPSLSGDGAILQHGKYFYRLSCSTTSCQWTIMEQELITGIISAVFIYLPEDITTC